MKDKSKLVSVVIYCDVLKKEVTIEENFFSLSASSQERDVCGSHGNITFYVNECECSGSHDIEIDSW